MTVWHAAMSVLALLGAIAWSISIVSFFRRRSVRRHRVHSTSAPRVGSDVKNWYANSPTKREIKR